MRTSRWIWLRLSRFLVKSSERLLKNLWQRQALLEKSNRQLSLQESKDLAIQLDLLRLECRPPLEIRDVSAVEDLQLASMRLTSTLENRES